MKRWLRAAGPVLCAALAACSQWDDARTAAVDGYTLAVLTRPSPPRVGERAEISVRITDAAGKPDDQCRVSSRQFMPGMPMSTDDIAVVMQPQGAGVYRASSHEYSMGGDWRLEVAIDCGGKAGKAVFDQHLEWPE